MPPAVLISYYEALRSLPSGYYRADSSQEAAVSLLQKVYDRYVGLNGFFCSRFFVRRDIAQNNQYGVWLYGTVGTGKTFLMDCLCAALPQGAKMRWSRWHFHQWMREIHLWLKSYQGKEDPLKKIAQYFSKKYCLICLDEFHVSDIADAMILGSLFPALFEYGVMCVVTSNYPPENLYPDGLHRNRFVPAIEVLKRNLVSCSVGMGNDYRLTKSDYFQADNKKSYFSPITASTFFELNQIFEEFAYSLEGQKPVGDDSCQVSRSTSIAFAQNEDEDGELAIPFGGNHARVVINDREIMVVRLSKTVAWFDFSVLCAGPRSQNDYLEIAIRFNTVILSGVPQMGPSLAAYARRFLWLIDVLYDQRVDLVVSAECEPEDLYPSGVMSHEFARTVSRIIEMQTVKYRESVINRRLKSSFF